jgi:hypothetical protein
VGRLALAVTVICGARLLDQDATTGRLTEIVNHLRADFKRHAIGALDSLRHVIAPSTQGYNFHTKIRAMYRVSYIAICHTPSMTMISADENGRRRAADRAYPAERQHARAA